MFGLLLCFISLVFSSAGYASVPIPQSGWSLLDVDSEELIGDDGAATNAFDGDPLTMWHTEWSQVTPTHPHEIQIDLGSVYDVDGFRYLPRSTGVVENGRVAGYRFYVSSDGVNWGAPVVSGVFANTAAEKELTFTAKTGRYVRLEALSEVNGNPWTSMAELNVLGVPSGGGGVVISQSGWSLLDVDSEELIGDDGAATNAFDGNPLTMWHTEWSQVTPTHPHEIQIDLGSVYDVDGFRYLPRSTGVVENGRVASYRFYVSSDGVNWGAPVVSGVLANTAAEKELTFTAKTGRYVRLEALSEVNGNPWTSMAELNVLGVPSGGNIAPNGTIVTPGDDITISAGGSVNFSGSGVDPDSNLPLSYTWNFDGAAPNSSRQNPGQVTFAAAGTYTVTLTVKDSELLSDPSPAQVTVTVVPVGAGVVISQSGWSLLDADSEELIGDDGAATNAFDGDPLTMWHTEWSQVSPTHPHEIQIDLGSVYDVDGFRYLPRSTGVVENGRVASYRFYVSSDGVNWGAPVVSGVLANTAAEKELTFTAKTGRYVRLEALSEVNGNPWTSMAELNVLGVPSGGNIAPNGTIVTPGDDITISAGGSVNFSGSGVDPDSNLPLSYTWDFDGAAPNSSQQNPGQVTFAAVGTYMVTLTVKDSELLPDPSPAQVTVTVVPVGAGVVISQSGWSLLDVDSEELIGDDGAATNAFDGDPLTMWHTEWSQVDPTHPHEIQIDLGSIHEIDGFRYQARQDHFFNGRISEYEFYVSLDGLEWGACRWSLECSIIPGSSRKSGLPQRPVVMCGW